MRTRTKIFLIFVSVIFLSFNLRSKDNICDFSKLGIQSVEDDTEVIALVLTRWQAFENRQVMRKMFTTFNTVHVFKPVFLMGIDRIPKEVLFGIQKENEDFQDLLLVNIEETYQNLPKKLLAAFHWIFNLKAEKLKWIVKLDDDLYINITKFDQYFSNIPNPETIHCLEMTNTKPVRDPKSQWYISKEDWNQDIYPPYCSGAAYILAPKTGELLFQTYTTHHLTNSKVWMEDLLLTGILARLANVQRTQVINMAYMGFLHKKANFFVAHPALMSDVVKTPKERLETWQKLFNV